MIIDVRSLISTRPDPRFSEAEQQRSLSLIASRRRTSRTFSMACFHPIMRMCENRLLMRGGELDKTGETFLSAFPEELGCVTGTVWDRRARLVNMLRAWTCF